MGAVTLTARPLGFPAPTSVVLGPMSPIENLARGDKATWLIADWLF